MNRKFFVFLAIMSMAAGLALNAQEGYQGNGSGAAQWNVPAPVTVEAAKTLRDNSPVILRGKIESALGRERYVFSDVSGSVTIKIDRILWTGLSVDQNDTVEIVGELEKERTRVEVDVKILRKI
ncbi:hypothetical protein AGMMS49940_24360 [Spirochaetia bacterium]|nr:hypothetical protein AGMMS49940_24360 [Spirochaetia bacterium]